MAEKCPINFAQDPVGAAENLQDVVFRVEGIASMYNIMGGTTEELISEITQELQTIASDDYAISSMTEVVDGIYNALVIQGVVNLNTTFFNPKNIRDILEGARLGVLPNSQIETSAEHASFQEFEQIRFRRNVTSQFLDDAYGMVSEARQQAINIANQHIFDALFINRGSINLGNQESGIVKSDLDLNRNVKLYQQQLLNKIVEYLNSIVTESMSLPQEVKDILANPILYNNESPTGILSVLNKYLIGPYLSRKTFNSLSDPTNRSLDGLRALYNMANNPDDSNYQAARLHLDAYNANVILQNFDSYLEVTLGDLIDIQDFGIKTGKDNKYAVGKKTAKLLTTWSSSEDRDVESEADFITKLAINTTPLYNVGLNTPIPGKFLTFADYQCIIGKIKDLSWNSAAIRHVIAKKGRYGNKLDTPEYFSTLSESTQNIIKSLLANSNITELRFSSLINMIRKNPRRYLSAIFEILSNSSFRNTLNFGTGVFSDGDNKVLYSLAKGVFSPIEANSLYKLSTLDAQTDYYSFITQVADTIFNVDYVQYYRDEDNTVQVRTFISQNVNNLRRNLEATINASNGTRTIRDIHKYELDLNIKPSSEQQITFTIPNTEITATVHSSGSEVIFKVGEDRITNFEPYLYNTAVLQFIDKKLRLGISDSIDLQNSLVETFQGKSIAINKLLSFASRIVLNQYIIYNTIDKENTIEEKEAKLKEIFGDNAPKYNKQLEITEVISGVDIDALRKAAIAKANVLGITTATQTKDGAGNGQSMQTQSRLLGSQWSQFELQETQQNSATKDCLILTIPGLYEGVYTAKEYYDGIETKSFVDMCVSEFAYSSFVMDYIGGLAINLEDSPNSLVGDGHVMFLPSVNSDKGTIGRIKIDLNKVLAFPDGTVKPLREFTHEDLRWLISEQFGKIYSNMYAAIQEDWNSLQGYLIDQGFTDLPYLKYISNFKEFNEWWVKKAAALGENFTKYGKTPSDFIKYFTLQYNQNHRLNPLTLVDQSHYQVKTQRLSINGEFVEVKGTLYANQVLLAQIAKFRPVFFKFLGGNLKEYPNEQDFWEHKHKEVLKSLLKSRFEINTTGNKSNSAEINYLRKNYPSWINASGNVILAKAEIGGTPVNITSTRDLIPFLQEGQSINDLIDNLKAANKLKLHPAVETWNYLEYLFTQEYMDCTVGSFINHPEKSKGKLKEEIIREAESRQEDPYPLVQKRIYEQEAAHFQAQHKRNVSFTAAMHEFQLNLLKGIPESYNIAVIDDIEDFQGTITGIINKIKPFDGATYVNPFVVLLENYALCGARAGITKKQFVHFKNERTGGGGIIKTAGFGLTNDWIRNSPFLQLMMQKMTDHVWLNEPNADGEASPAIVNITRNYRGYPITLKNRYFEKEGNVYEIVRVESLGNNQYRRVIQQIEVDEENRPMVDSHIGEELIEDRNGKLWLNSTCNDLWVRENTDIINTNYKLWQFFGGSHSMSINDSGKYLEYSNSSVENVVELMNNVAGEDANGNIITRNGVDIAAVETQHDLWQPLKQVDVHYVATAGAVKQGAANINSADKYHNNVAYDIQRIKMYQAGIQLDKEHHADQAELSLMTQVISACAAKGYTFEAAATLYGALKKSTEIGIDKHLKAVKEFITSNNPTGVQEAMYEAIIHSLGTGNTNQSNFAYLVASDLIRQAREGKKIKFSEVSLPLSDSTVRNKIFSTVSSYLTNAGIKQKIPGILSVLTPSYNIFKIYDGKKLEAYTNPRKELAKIQEEYDLTPVFDSAYQWTQGQQDFSGLQLVYVNPGELISQIDEQPVAMRNTHDGRVLIDLELMKAKFDQKAWRNTRNSEPLDYDFKSFDEWMRFALLHEAMHNVYLIKDGESRFDYETRVNKQALKRLQNNISNIELGRTYKVTRNVLVEVKNPDGTIGQTVEQQTFWELINNPRDYRNLKRDIALGQISVQDIRELSDVLHAPELRFDEGTPEYEQAVQKGNEILSRYNISQLTDEEHYLIYNEGQNDNITPETLAVITEILTRVQKPVINQVLRVSEAVIDKNGDPLGRDLAAYNVRFNTTDGQRFQLWDLDSAQALFRINEINSDKKLTKQQKVEQLIEVSNSIFPNQVIDTNNLETLVRRMLQKDLMNLSKEVPDIMPQYEELLESFETFQPQQIEEKAVYKWGVHALNSYEVSTAGDSRFSALNARFAQGTQFMGYDISNMTLEDVYQTVIKKSGKGLPPANTSILYNPNLKTTKEREDFSYTQAYLPLWQEWAKQNPQLIEELRQAAKGKVLTDRFALKTTVTQARALADILTQTEPIQEPTSEPLSWYDRYAQWVNIYLGTGNGSEIEINTIVPKNELTYISPGETTQSLAAEIGGIDTLRHPDANGMHFGNPFSHANYEGAIKVGSVKRAVQAYEEWLRKDPSLDQWLVEHVSPEEKQKLDIRRDWILQQINSGALDNKELIYYRTTVPDNSYGTQLGGTFYSYNDAPNHAHILQKLILEHNPSLGRLDKKKVKITEKNFAKIEPEIRKAILATTKVRINGSLQTVNKDSINIQAYEIIMPKTFASNFGLDTFDSLSEIKNDRDWFVTQYIKNSQDKVSSDSYTIALKNANGNHTYLLSKAQLDSINDRYQKVERENIGLMNVDGKLVRLDTKGNIMYQISEDFELYVDSTNPNNEIIVTNDLTFYINNTSFDSIHLSETLRYRPWVFQNVLESINASKNSKAKYFYRFIKPRRENNLDNIFENSIEYNRIPAPTEEIYESSRIIKSLREKHTSFIKALDVVAARIPSQSMQSFMPMRVIAFDNPDINTAYVSTLQILLQGSDY